MKHLIVLFLLFSALPVSAQHADDGYRPYIRRALFIELSKAKIAMASDSEVEGIVELYSL